MRHKTEEKIYMSALILIIIAIIVFAFKGGDAIKDFEIIKPEKGIHCVVVSRGFNTSVDCWKVKEKKK